MASLSKLPKEERDRLIQQYGSGMPNQLRFRTKTESEEKIIEVDETSRIFKA